MRYAIVKEGDSYGVFFDRTGHRYRLGFRLTVVEAIAMVRHAQEIDKLGPRGRSFDGFGGGLI